MPSAHCHIGFTQLPLSHLWAHISEANMHRIPMGWHVRAGCVAAACLVAGALAGSVAASSMSGGSAHHDGACLALRMAAAHGYLDERQQRVVMRTLATALNPEAHLFPGGYDAMRRACEAVATRSS